MENQKPLVSIFSVVKNGAYTIRRCVESVLCQDYSNIEFIIQDGASTDGTLEVLKEYATKYEGRIKLVSEPDSCGGEGFYCALRRCTGDIIGSCLSDEELLPHAVSWAVEQFERHPDAGAVYGDYYTTDIDGNVTKENRTVPFDLCAYLLHEIVPPFCSSFFKRSAFENIGMFDKDWRIDVGEFEIWVRMGLKYPIYYEPGLVSKFAKHPGSNTSKPAVMLSLISGRLEVMRKVFSDEATPAQIRAVEQQGYAGLHLWIANTIVHLGAYEEAAGQIRQALAYQPNAQRLGIIFRRLPKTISAYDVLERQVREYMNESALPAPAAPGGVSSTNPAGDSQKQRLEMFRGWIDTLVRAHNRLYYRDQTPASLNVLVELVERYKPTKIVEMGTLSGLSLRTDRKSVV